MQIILKQLPQSKAEMTIEIPVEEVQPQMRWAAGRLASANNIPGFRPGKAPYEIVKKQFGETKILEIALERLIKQTYFQAVKEKQLETIGAPEITVEKAAPGNPVVFKAAMSLLPQITLGDWQKLKLKRQKKEIKEEKIIKILDDLRRMQAKETLVDRPAQKSDKVIVDMDITLDKVPIEGGQARDHAIYLEEDYYIPGLTEKIINTKKGDTLEFQMPFPENFFKKNLAGKNADFNLNLKAVYERVPAELDDEFVQKLGQKSLADLKNLIQQNLQKEAEQKEEQRMEIELLQTLIKQTKFSEIPEILIKEEKQKMFAELKASLSEQGLDFENYLANIKKTEEEIAQNFSAGARERAETALVLREIAKQENIKITPEEMEKELLRVREMYQNNGRIEERLASFEVRDYITHSLLNRKVLQMLKEKVIE